jgi:ATPase subunit of ABC transporter with duplicated ATPase domains
MLSTVNLAIQFGAKPLFEGVSLKFTDGNRYGLIGANGCGKSTLIKILGGDLEPSAGEVILQPGLRLGKLSQNQFVYADPAATDDDYMRAAELEVRFAEYGGYDAEARAASILVDAGIGEALHTGPMREVPPGLKLRVLLAQALFSKPDVLLLDEPTNNLDIHSIQWLEGVLNESDSTMIIISHDRHFLNQVCTHIADLDYQQVKVYPGNYDDFMLASTQARARVEASNAKAQERIAELQEFVRRFSANASKARQATSRKRAIDKIKIEEIRPSSRQNPYIRFEQLKKLYRSAFNLDKLSFRYPGSEEWVLKDISTNIEAGDRVAVIGANGIGKTTLMHCIAGVLKPTSGSVNWVENAEPGYMPQDPQAEFTEKMDLLTWMSQWTGKADDELITRATLGRLLFSGDETKKSVKVLSGGEKNRMMYGKLLLQRPNVMLMDEPTNHMDMETIESLQIGLEKYPGTLVFVSHDREFVSGLANRIIEIQPGGGIIDHRGSYDEYLAERGQR